jgi:hypothetical protein
VKFEPMAPPIMLRPAMWEASEGCVVKRWAMLVRAPVAINHAIPGGVEERAA